MVRRSCDGAGLLEGFRAGVANLEAHVDEINALNVFPVPDGDTGSNMVATVRAALAEAGALSGAPAAGRVAGAISFGALMGARGNSGVITSQILRGIADGLENRTRFSGPDLAHALSRGSEAAYRAVAKPVEGTILTVIREAAAAAVASAEGDGDAEAVLTAAVEAAERAVARTPSLLPILREAGVVDSGGQGLVRMLQGALRHLVEGSPAGTRLETGPYPGVPRRAAILAHADEEFGYETVFLLQAPSGTALDLDAIRSHLETIGSSVLVAGDARAVKVHVHNERPDLVIAHGLSLGTLTRISVENLDRQVREAHRAADDSQGGAHATADGSSGGTETGGSRSVAGEPMGGDAQREGLPGDATRPLGVIAVLPGDGFEPIFREFGVASVVRGGQGANPSTGELLEAVRAATAPQILILPNNPNVILAARQVSAMTDRPVEVVPTRNAAEGLAALLALDPRLDAAGNVDQMTAAARALQTFVITRAVRDSSIGGLAVKLGQTIALDPDDGLIAVDDDPLRAASAAVGRLRPGYELLTIYYGDGSGLDEAERLARALSADLSGVDVEVVHGGQPHYRYLVAAE